MTAVTFCEWWLSETEEEDTKIVAIPEMSAAVPTEPPAVATPSNAIESEQKPLTLAEAQAIAQSIVGPVHWRGDDGFCRCPGENSHTTPTAATDCKVVCMPMPLEGGTLAPGIYCFHGSCADAREDANHKLRSALGKRTAATGGIVALPYSPSRPRSPSPSFSCRCDEWRRNSTALMAPARRAESGSRTIGRPQSFLRAYEPGECRLRRLSRTASGEHDRHRRCERTRWLPQ